MEWIIVIFLLATAFFIYVIYENENPILEEINLYSKKACKKITILHISDLHSKLFGHNQKRLIKLIPGDIDLILLTGDLVDRRLKNTENPLKLIENLREIPKIYIRGNHEKGIENYVTFKSEMERLGVSVLQNQILEINIQGNKLSVIGLDDPREYKNLKKVKDIDEKAVLESNLSRLLRDAKSDFKILLSHRPEFFDMYVESGVDYVFSGHAHGGYVQIFGRGLFAAEQGFFAKYAGGVFKKQSTTMINSRGLGNNFAFVKRVFNRPHITKVNIYAEK